VTLIHYDCVHEVGLCAQVYVRHWLFLNGHFRGGLYVMSPLVDMAHGSSWRHFQMLVDIVFCQSGPSDQMSVFDLLQHRIFRRAE
jgi:hypothetical protein